jgi:hypothetical protein
MLMVAFQDEAQEELKYKIILQAIWAALADGDGAKKQIDEYNNLLGELADLRNPERKKERKNFYESQKEILGKINNSSNILDFLGKKGEKIRLTLDKKIEGEKNISLSNKLVKNFGKLNG